MKRIQEDGKKRRKPKCQRPSQRLAKRRTPRARKSHSQKMRKSQAPGAREKPNPHASQTGAAPNASLTVALAWRTGRKLRSKRRNLRNKRRHPRSQAETNPVA